MGFHGSFLGDKVDFVLDDHDVFNASDFQRHQVLTGLRLRARFVGGHHQPGTVHDGGARDHDGHQRLVAGGVHERDDSLELRFHIVSTVGSLPRCVELSVVVFVERRIGVAEFDGNTPLPLLGMGVGPHAREGLRQRRLSVIDVGDDAEIASMVEISHEWQKRAKITGYGKSSTLFLENKLYLCE